MKVGVIGNGNVGLAVFRELQDVRDVSEIVLIGRNPEKVKAEVDDYRDAAILRNYPSPRFSSGGYEASEGCDILIYTAGSNKLGKDRMEMLETNCAITRDIFGQINKYNRDSIIICITKNSANATASSAPLYSGFSGEKQSFALSKALHCPKLRLVQSFALSRKTPRVSGGHV